MEGVMEDSFLGQDYIPVSEIVSFFFDTPVGEYLSLVFENKVLNGDWPNTVHFCGLVYRKSHDGVPLKECLMGFPNTHPSVQGFRSQYSRYTCDRACKNAFPTFLNKKRRERCYDKCDDRCSYNWSVM